MGRRCSPSRGDGSRGQSASRRSSGEQGGKKEQGSISLLVRNISHDCSYDLLAAFQKFGRIRDFYIPKDYYSGEPRGFAFIEFWDSRDASEAQRRMNHKMVCGREINVVRAEGKRKHPDGTPRETGVRGHSDYKGRHVSRHGRSRSHSHSRSPRHGGRHRSRSHSPARRRHGDYSASPKRKEECQTKSSGQSKEHDKGKKQGPCTPPDRSDHHDADNGSNGRRATPDYSASPKRTEEYQIKSPRQATKHDEDKRQRSYTPTDRNDRREASDDHNERDDNSTSPKRKEECLAKSPRLSNEHDKDKKRRSCSRDDGNNCCDADIGLKENNVHVDRRQVTTGGEGSCPRQRSPRPSSRSHSRRRDDYSASPKGKEKHQEQPPRHSKENDKCKKRRSSAPDIDNRNDRRDVDHRHNERRATTGGVVSCPRQRSPRPSSGSHSRRRDDYSASPKGKEEHQEQSPRRSKEYGKCKKRRSDSPDDRNNRRDADHSHNDMQDDHPTSPKIKEEHQSKSSGESKEYDKDTKRRSYAPHDSNDHLDADNGSKDTNVHVDRKLATLDADRSHAGRRSPGPYSTLSSRRQDDYSASAKTKEELCAKSPKQSNEHEDEKRSSYTPDERNDRRDADNCNKKKQADYSASPKRKEECQVKSPRQTKDPEVTRRSYTPDDRIVRHEADNGYNEKRPSPDNGPPKRTEEPCQEKPHSQSNEFDNDKKQRSYTHDYRKDRGNADNDSKERRNDYSASGNKEEHGANFPRLSKEHDEHKKRGSFTPDDRDDHHDTDNGSKERDDNSASRKRMEDHRAKSPRQSKEHENDKRGSYTHDGRKDHCDADNGSRERRDDYSASRNRKEEHRAKSPRQLKEHDDNKKRGSFTPDDRSDHHDTDNGSKKRDDNSASRKRMEDHRAKSPRHSKGHENDKNRDIHDDRKDRCDADNGSRDFPRRRDDNSASRKRIEDRRAKSPRQSKEYENDKRGSYTRDDSKDHSDAANGSRGRRDDYVSPRKRKEECRGKSPRRSKEHDENKKRGSYAPDDRNDRHDVDRDRNEKLATHDSKGSRLSPRRRSPRPSTGSHSRSGDRTRAR
ncbi:uncharacterized protein [Lolium perenne]|uniref:uncharacterized protein isoform X2 n=1 Tax=Lolium perenne TaxID=4522 RepID=UPI0021F61DAD|nr:uncharacterized protein LOC127294634 isoform X4 [Lolium perenne]